MEFKKLDGFNLEVASSGFSSARILVFRTPDCGSPWDQVEGSRIVVVGGDIAKRELKKLLTEYGRDRLQSVVPGGISGSPHTALRTYVGL